MSIREAERIREALRFIDASDRDTWLRIGMAIKSQLPNSEGFHLWDTWSRQADSYNAKDARDVWRSIRPDGGVTIGSLFYEAKANGWRDDRGGYQKPTPEELAERRRIAAERALREEAEIARERANTASKAAAIMKAATEAKADHPYLTRKRVSPVATLREIDAGEAAAILGYAPKSGGELLAGRLLVVPVKQVDRISTLELIDESGRKAALAGRGSKVGGYWATERLPDCDGAGLILLIGEGVATVLSASAATGKSGVAALSSGNLPAVAKAVRERYQAATLVILADLVKASGEPDHHATEAARSVCAKLAIPDFGADRAPDMKDMNDLAIIAGPEAVKRAIASATAPIPCWPSPRRPSPCSTGAARPVNG
jgi:putative DNA primase/helicase